ncbi:tRNA (adenosine(37)-N6)-dimethylallyltransferase MiaA [Treponema sp.]|uniref:tRNA (adenosine(37)-N6)-dimethylallyltransferase MiaA n=1 Tax=Treponema sp. TaxID=166 RepID=UPI0025F8AD8F|nr:tRNA (adenosine(37)-N6)-dimethylallyltransferase MiaA [Treponema sp.]MCR5218750.1 tRNA (adenosine(37)-N6)-dimethylallyltransferase MiaA [Treponema sp.]
MKSVIVIFAPTACGKTALAEDLFGKSSLSCFKGRGEVVSADSQTVYRGLNIGTAKPSPAEMEELPHHLIDIADPQTQFGAGEFMDAADSACREILSRNHFPLVVGGSGFYMRNFLMGLTKAPVCPDEIRLKIKKRLDQEGPDTLYRELLALDPLYASKISPNDHGRVCRALEVFYTSGKPLSSYKMPDSLRRDFDFLVLILNRQREDLYRRIDLRVDRMFEEGLEEEVRALKASGCTKDTPAMKAIGYSEFFEEGLKREEIKEKIKLDSRHYAKKQYTFMKGIPGAFIVDADNRERIENLINQFCSGLKVL